MSKNYTFRLFRKTPGFIDGMASNFNFFGDESRNYVIDESAEEADCNSIYSDWKAVGGDMKVAFNKYEKTVK